MNEDQRREEAKQNLLSAAKQAMDEAQMPDIYRKAAQSALYLGLALLDDIRWACRK